MLSSVSKVAERCIHSRIFPVIEESRHELQHGFVEGPSPYSQLLSVCHDISRAFDLGVQTDLIYLDFSKAFDKLRHMLLLHKLWLSWILAEMAFILLIDGRQQRVAIGGEESEWAAICSGLLPQGLCEVPFCFCFTSMRC